jgi:hypothetical protein
VSTPAEVMATLDTLAREVDQRSRELADVERTLAPVEDRYDDGYEDFIGGMFDSEDGKRLPGEDVRRALYHRDLRAKDAALLGEYRKLNRSRKRLEKRIQSLKSAVDAQRSILSALKVELEALS